jgi:LmbE family N-acetylglucosaminyl deacetylase
MVVLAALPDDEVLGAGGIRSFLASASIRLQLVAVTDGEAPHPGQLDPASPSHAAVPNEPPPCASLAQGGPR